eukprot:TRINITY_DN20126_c0_g1_i1.p1 TRINITY_DN20126_c0_g1~~TRINITY_DN20126_c0_g1_i1.p1  ORF type:complete len:141 (-),score=17.16 TRINITY_DN20126_c0_g1_i1:355-777(-)
MACSFEAPQACRAVLPMQRSVGQRFRISMTLVPASSTADYNCAEALEMVPEAFVQRFLQEVADILLCQPEDTATTTYIGGHLSAQARTLLRVPGITLTRCLRCYSKDFLVEHSGREMYVSYVYNLNGKDADYPPGRYISF